MAHPVRPCYARNKWRHGPQCTPTRCVRRCCKLLYLGVRPVFVFDGATPALKRRTLAIRRSLRDKQAARLRRIAESLVMKRLKQDILRKSHGPANFRIELPVPSQDNGLEPQRQHGNAPVHSHNIAATDDPGSSLPMEMESVQNDSNTVLFIPEAESESASGTTIANLTTSNRVLDCAWSPTIAESFETRGFPDRTSNPPFEDDGRIVPLDAGNNLIGTSDRPSNYETEEAGFYGVIALPEDIQAIDDEELVNLPAELQAEVFKQIRIQQRLMHRESVLGMHSNPAEFSRAQIQGFLRNTALNKKFSKVRNVINSRSGVTNRIASDHAREYILEEDSDDEVENHENDDIEFNQFDSSNSADRATSEKSHERVKHSRCHGQDGEDEEEEEDDDDILRRVRREKENRGDGFPLRQQTTHPPQSLAGAEDDAGVAWACRVLSNGGSLLPGAGGPDSGEDSTLIGAFKRTGNLSSCSRLRNLWTCTWDNGHEDNDEDETSKEEKDVAEPCGSNCVQPSTLSDKFISPDCGSLDGLQDDSDDGLEWEDGNEDRIPCVTSMSSSIRYNHRPLNSGCELAAPSSSASPSVPSVIDEELLISQKENIVTRYGKISRLRESEVSPVGNVYNKAVDQPQFFSSAQKSTAMEREAADVPKSFEMTPHDNLDYSYKKADARTAVCSLDSLPLIPGTAGIVPHTALASAPVIYKVDPEARDEAVQLQITPTAGRTSLPCGQGVIVDATSRTAVNSAEISKTVIHEGLANTEPKRLYNHEDCSVSFAAGHDSTKRPQKGSILSNVEILGDGSGPMSIPSQAETVPVLSGTTTSTGSNKNRCSKTNPEPVVDSVQKVSKNSYQFRASRDIEKSALPNLGGADRVNHLPNYQSSSYDVRQHAAVGFLENTTVVTNPLDADQGYVPTASYLRADRARNSGPAEHESEILNESSDEVKGFLDGPESLSDEMFGETRELLRLLGMPYLEAPMEAEAQCAFLSIAGLVDAVVTEDSDAFLFGAKVVYRNIFMDGKFAEKYDIECIRSELGVDREQLIKLALLLGSDYTPGVRGVGIVNSMEILEAFPGARGLEEFEQWVRSVTLLQDLSQMKDDEEEVQVGTPSSVRHRFCWKHRNMKRNWEIPDGFPSENVMEAYRCPAVNKSTKPFQWNAIDVQGLRRFCWEKFGWDEVKFLEATTPVLKEMDRHRGLSVGSRGQAGQTAIDDFFKPHRFAKIRSERLQQAVKGIAGERSAPLLAGPRAKTPDERRRLKRAREEV